MITIDFTCPVPVETGITNSLLDLSLVFLQHVLDIPSWRHQWARVMDPILLRDVTLNNIFERSKLEFRANQEQNIVDWW